MKRILFVLALLGLGFISSFAQEKQPKVIEYKAPIYPPVAKAVHAGGEIMVAVKIDKDGKVTSANAISGFPLLQKISEKTAKEWIFSPSKNANEREVKVYFVYKIEYKSHKQDKIIFKKPYRLEYILRKPPIVLTSPSKKTV